MKIQTTRFGVLEIEDSKLITFPFGLPGFEHLSRWCILHPQGDIDISWFQSVDDASVALLTANPDALLPDYDIVVNDRDLAPIGVHVQKSDTEAPPIALRVVVTVNGASQDLTANLRAPILINTATLLGLQLPLIGTEFSVNHPLVIPPATENKTNGHKTNGHKTNGNGIPINGSHTKTGGCLSVKTDSGLLKSHATANS